jgi:hypothetical protein
MERASALATGDKRYKLTPPDELRYIEGLLDLPMGHMKEFGMIAAVGHESCLCGRIPSASDVVVTALKQGIHGKALVRDTLLGAQNIFEMSDAGLLPRHRDREALVRRDQVIVIVLLQIYLDPVDLATELVV